MKIESNITKVILLLGTLFLFTGCYTNRYIPEGSYRLDETEQTVIMTDSTEATPEVKDALKNSENYYVQRKNSKVLGIKGLPVGMWIYGIAKPTDSSFVGKYFRQLGQAPVIYDEEKSKKTARQLQGLLENKGCFHSTVTFDTIYQKGKKIAIGFRIVATPRYKIEDVEYFSKNETVLKLLNKWRSSALVKEGDYYDQDLLASERARIVSNLREEGYYKASIENVVFLVDTTYNNDRRLSIDVVVDSTDLHVYYTHSIYIYPNSTAGLRQNESAFDTTIAPFQDLRGNSIDFDFVKERGKKMTIDSTTICRAMMMFPGTTYRPSNTTNTYNSLLNLRNFKYINIEYKESPFSTNTLPLVDAHVRLINTTQQKISLSFELTNASPISATDSNSNFFSSGNLGLETGIEYQHKNIFGGAELLKIKSSLLLELPKFILNGGRGSFYDNFSAFEVNLDVSLDIPDAWPISSLLVMKMTRPHTLFSVGGSYQYRYWFERILTNMSYGYSWTHRKSWDPSTSSFYRIYQHQLLPIELTFVRILNLDDDFATRLLTISDLRTIYQYSSHFIMDARYDHTYSNQQYGTRRNFSYYHMSVESAGLLLNALSNIVNGNSDSNAVRQFFDVPFSQYTRFTGELTRYIYHHKRNTLVLRAMLGIGIPYGNSSSMPYEKSFFGGGPTTIRAWQLRRLGPGSCGANTGLIDRVGDMQLVLNLEERFPIAGIFEGALFADMGNIWLLNPSELYPGGELRWDEFYKEIAAGVGLGLRVNVSIATLRLDFAIPLYDPGYSQSERWRLPHWKFSQIITNFGINYPF